MTNIIEEIAEKRRSNYSLGNRDILSSAKIVELVEHAVKYCPTAFNSQSARVVILFNDDYQKLWKIALEELQKVTPADKFYATELKIKSFAKGLGTILFFEDEDVVKGLQNKFAIYKDKFPHWSEQANGMLQYIVWASLAENDIGASLQHYNPLVDAKVYEQWKVPAGWKLIAQMPFGSIEAPAEEKTFLPIEQRVKVFS